MDARQNAPLWEPAPARIAATNLRRFMDDAGRRAGRRFDDFAGLHRWSIEDREGFWRLIWDWGRVIGEPGAAVLEAGDRMPGARFFPTARLNYAENLLRKRDGSDALIFRGEDKVRRRLSWAELYDQVSRLAQAMRVDGIGPGDRVGGIVANMPEAIIGMLAAASLGAAWSSCSPDFGVKGVLDRFGQIEPKLILAVDGYFYNGKTFDNGDKNRRIAAALPSLKRIIVVPYIGSGDPPAGLANAKSYTAYVAPYAPRAIDFARLPFDHPLYIMYSSGTTGVPKCIVHGAGGSLLKHIVEQQLHCDLKDGDRLFYFTTCGWMMWNWLATGLSAGATLLLYDGSPFHPSGNVLFDYADDERMTHFGTSAKYIDSVLKAGLEPIKTHKLSTVRYLSSTGSPLSPEGFDFVYRGIKRDLFMASISGGTDIMGCFVMGNPIGPVWRGEIAAPVLGMAVDVFRDDGSRAADDEKGELVCTEAFPSMPLGFWNDPGDAKYHAAYFERFANIWCHGDYAARTRHGGFVIHGRSDAVLNPGGVRIGTAEIYRQVEQIPDVLESLVVAQEWQSDVRVVLFVKLRDGVTLDAALIQRINRQIRANASPRHVPARTVQVADIPRTKSGKIVELAVREVVHGRPVKNLEALANPEALAYFRDRPELRS
ncbi:MAG TPA: acetoacetate--CoA ligase [Stellaceae bacterium]|nr:acetoacetate--CoA ligase [Stellaceae bacterium]